VWVARIAADHALENPSALQDVLDCRVKPGNDEN
jgi:hypothetical protein